MRIAFLHVPKCAGSSLLAWCSNNKIQILGHDRHPTKKRKSFTYAFAFVRNPYDRVVSAYSYLKAGGNSRADRIDGVKYCGQDNFKDFVMNGLEVAFKEQIHFMPLHYWIYDRFSLKDCTIGRYENLLGDYTKIANDLGLKPYKRLPHVNPTKHKPYEELYDDEMKEKVHQIYKKDFKLFGYDNS